VSKIIQHIVIVIIIVDCLTKFIATESGTFCVVLQCLQQRALHPNDSLADLSPVVEASLRVPSLVASKTQPVLEQLKSQFKLEPVAKKETATGEAVFNA